MLILILVAGGLLAAVAAAAQGAQTVREKRAKSAEQREAEAAESGLRLSRNPQHYISVQAARITRLLATVRERLRHRGIELGRREAELAAAQPGESTLQQRLTYAAPVMLVALFALSISQLGPSFHALADPGAPSPTLLDWVFAALLATLEIAVGFAVAKALRPAQGWRELGPKLAAIPVLLLAALLIYGQYSWAPLHDTIPLRQQLAAAQEQLTLDQQNHKPQIDLTADRQAIASVQSRLPEVTVRDEVLAVAVTLGADVAAIPALSALGYLGDARRRRRLRKHITAIRAEIASLEQEQVEIPARITLETQTRLAELGIDPNLALAARAAPAAIATAPPQPALPAPPLPAPPPPAPPAPPPPPAPGGTSRNGTLTPDDLFPPAPGGPPVTEPPWERQTQPAPPAGDDRRWTDPL